MPPPLLGIYRPDSVTPSPDTSVKNKKRENAEKKLKILKAVLDSNGRPRHCHVLRSWRNIGSTCSKTRFPLIMKKYKNTNRMQTFTRPILNVYKRSYKWIARIEHTRIISHAKINEECKKRHFIAVKIEQIEKHGCRFL